jgi:hypothetical protein
MEFDNQRSVGRSIGSPVTQNWRRDMNGWPYLSAEAIPVSQFREILIWPLALHLRGVHGAAASLGAINEAARSMAGTCWTEVADPSEHIAPPECGSRAEWDANRYAEAVYFHEFVQHFLVARSIAGEAGGTRAAPFRLFRRADIESVEVTLAGGNPTAKRRVSLIVDRFNLYLFCTGAAALVVELHWMRDAQLKATNGRFLSLADVQDFHEQFRRTYVPYANGLNFAAATGVEHNPPDLVVRHVTWRFRDGSLAEYPIDSAALTNMIREYLDRMVADPSTGLERRLPPVFTHWRDLLPEQLLIGWGSASPDRPRWHPVMDERMPTLLTVSVTPAESGEHPYKFMRATTDDDLVKLCYADSAGKEQAVLYDAPNIDAFFAQHVYSAYRALGTLYLVSGYAFVAYGAGWFFDKIVADVHVRRHYFQIGLLQHLELASLLSFSSRITRAVAEHDPAKAPVEEFETAMHAIEDEYLQFLHRFRFTHSSNHLQARELTELWRRNLRLPELFADLHTEITSATQYLFNRAASRSAATVERLTVIGTLGLVVTLTLTFLGMSIIIQPVELADLFHYSFTLLRVTPSMHAAELHPVRRIFGEIGVAALATSASTCLALQVWNWVWRDRRTELNRMHAKIVHLLKYATSLDLGLGLALVAGAYILYVL